MNKTSALVLGAILGVAAFVGIAAVNVVPTGQSLPANAAGYLLNDGAGGLSWGSITGGFENTVTNGNTLAANELLAVTSNTNGVSSGVTSTSGSMIGSSIRVAGYGEATSSHTDAGGWTINLSLTNRAWSCVNTGAIAVTFSGFTEGNQLNIVLGNSQATNCATTWTPPASTFVKWLGLELTNMAPAKWQTIYGVCKTVTGTNYIFLTGTEQQ